MAITLSSLKKGRELKPPMILGFGTHGVGKALENSMPVLMGDGTWKAICEIKVGEIVSTPDGKTAPVLGVFPQGKRKVMELRTNDGASVVCDEDHLWLTETLNERRNDMLCSGIFERGRVRTTRQIMETLRTRNGTKVETWAHYIPIAQPHGGSDDGLLLDGYALGALLGDGSFTEDNSVTLTCADIDIMERMQDVGFAPTSTQVKKGTSALNYIYGGKRDLLRDMKIYGENSSNEHIPLEYFSATIETRVALFQGLMDTDGTWTNSAGVAEYCTISHQLAKDFVQLVRSLGCTAKTFEKRAFYTHKGERREGKLAYSIVIKVPEGLMPFYAARKLARWREREMYSIYRQIVSIEPVGEAECTCIYIGHPQHLYITKDYLVTHNSSWAMKAPNPIFLQTEEGLNSLDVVKTPKLNSVDEVFQWIGVLANEDHPYQTLVLDTIDHFEQLVHKHVRQLHGEAIFSEYGKGYKFAFPFFQNLIDGLTVLRDKKNMTIILLGHAKIFTFNSPDQPSYDRYAPDLHESVCSYVEECMDCVLFFSYKVYVAKTEANFGKSEKKATGKGDRVTYTQERPPFRAKNRYWLEPEIPMSYDAFLRGVKAGLDSQLLVVNQPVEEKVAEKPEEVKEEVKEDNI